MITGRAKARRDLRFDVFRGLAIYVITLNHSELLKVRVGSFYDCADLFIFISGFVCGMAYYRTAAKRGLRGLVAKAWRRSVQLALANVGVIGLVVSISLLAVWQLDIDPEVYRAGAIIDDPTSGLVEAFTFRSRLRLVDILVIYVLLLAWLPFAFFLYFKDRRIAVAVAVALYIYPIVAENFALPLSENLLFNVRFGHPLSWQLVFSIGLALGLERKRGTPFPVESKSLLAGALLVLAACHVGRFGMTQHYIWLLAGKFTARPLRIAEILSATYVIAFFLPAEHPLWRHRALAFFRMAGRRALPVFCGSVVISAVGLAYAQCCAGGWYRTAGGVLLLLMLLSMWTVAVSRFLGPGRFKAEP